MIRPTEDDVIGDRVQIDQTEGLGLFDAVRERPAAAAPPRVPPRTIATARAGEHDDRAEAIEKLKGLIREPLLARAAARKDRLESPGVVADDAIELCRAHVCSALLGPAQRAYSWVGPWMTSLARSGKLAEYVAGGQIVRRRSTRPGAHGNLQVVYLHPDDFRVGKA